MWVKFSDRYLVVNHDAPHSSREGPRYRARWGSCRIIPFFPFNSIFHTSPFLRNQKGAIMAIFGNLEHHAFHDLVKVLRSQTGTLFFHEAYQGRTLELILSQGRLQALFMDGFPIQNPMQVGEMLRQLRAQGRGAFEFQRRAAVTTPRLYDLALDDFAGAASGEAVPLEQLPHPETRFVAAPSGVVTVPTALSAMWTMLQPHLETGASAMELARRLPHPEDDLRVMLHRLRAADLIAPQRAAPAVALTPSWTAPVAAASSSSSFQTSATPVPFGPVPVVQRLLGALRRLTGVPSL